MRIYDATLQSFVVGDDLQAIPSMTCAGIPYVIPDCLCSLMKKHLIIYVQC